MKTAISLPDDLFKLADEFAQTHGLSRSELYATALREYLDTHHDDRLVERINEACVNIDTGLSQEQAATARRTLLESEW